MFYINQATPTFIFARNEHYTNVRYIIKKKLLGKYFTEPHPKGLTKRINQVTKIHANVKVFLMDDKNLNDILIGSPDVLNKLKSKFTTRKEKDSIKRLLRYDAFVKTDNDDTFSFYNAYNLAENVSIDTCVYCNRLYTHTIITDKGGLIARPSFDHWFPKSTYPMLALSFYNLIPSCNVCNSSVKGTTTLSLDKNFHPYYKHPNTVKHFNFKFTYTLEDHLLAESKLNPFNKFSEDSLAAMKLKEIYKVHHEEIRELIYLKRAYSEGYLSSLRTLLKSPLSREEIYRISFGVYLEDEQLIRRPLSKLKKDILDELGLLTESGF